MTEEWLWRGEKALRLDVWMARALYDEGFGYYARSIRGVGHGGDFTTVPMQTDGLAKGIAHWLASEVREKRVFHVVELGAGEGKLLQDVRKFLPWSLRWRVKWGIVEISKSLREKQQARLGRGVAWYTTIEQALRASSGRAIFYSNELLDAFPARQFCFDENETWREAWRNRAGGMDWRAVDERPDSRQFDDVSELGATGQRIEVQESLALWLAGWMPRWRAGAFLAVDYGAATTREMIFRRPLGTLRGYFHQQIRTGEEVFQNPGHQDLTLDVHWGDFSRWFEKNGGKMTDLRTQREFLTSCGMGDESAWNQALGAGDAFQVWRGEAQGNG